MGIKLGQKQEPLNYITPPSVCAQYPCLQGNRLSPLTNPQRPRKLDARRHTFWLSTRHLLCLRANHCAAFTPASCILSGVSVTLCAISGDSSVSAFKCTELPGRVKNTNDQRSKCDCASGGGLRSGRQSEPRVQVEMRTKHGGYSTLGCRR